MIRQRSHIFLAEAETFTIHILCGLFNNASRALDPLAVLERWMQALQPP